MYSLCIYLLYKYHIRSKITEKDIFIITHGSSVSSVLTSVLFVYVYTIYIYIFTCISL